MARRVIHKHRLVLDDGPQIIEVQGKGAEVLDFQIQHDVLTIWTLENYRSDDDPTEETFLVLGTGAEVEYGWTYVGTVQHGQFVWHLFRGVR